MNINSQPSGAPAQATDEFLINRSGTDYKLTHGDIIASIESALALEESDRQSADTNLENTKLSKSGGNMTGFINLHANPTSNSHAATKEYVDTLLNSKLSKAGGTMTGSLVLSGDPTTDLMAATKQYVDSVGDGKWKNTTDIDCSTNPNYPASTVGTTYRVTGSGKIGGVSGKTVQVDDIVYCYNTDATGGTEAAVGNKYLVIQTNLVQASQSIIGYSRIATDNEINAGTNDSTVITPRGARKVVSELVPNYAKTSSALTSVNIPASTQSNLYLLSGTSSGVVTVTLPTIASITGSTEFTLTIKDAGQNAATNNIIINRSGSDTIDGASSYTISADSGSISIVTDGNNWYTI